MGTFEENNSAAALEGLNSSIPPMMFKTVFIYKLFSKHLFTSDVDPLCGQGVNEAVVCKNHLILGQHLYKDMQGRDFTLFGGEKMRVKVNQVIVFRWSGYRLSPDSFRNHFCV